MAEHQYSLATSINLNILECKAKQSDGLVAITSY